MDLQDPIIIERLQVLSIAIGLAALAFWIAWRCHYFVLPAREPPTTPGTSLPFRYVLAGFVTYLGVQLFIVPFLWIAYFLKKEHRWPNEADMQWSLEDQGWLNIYAILAAGLALLLFSLFLKQGMFKKIWIDNKKGIGKYLKDLLLGSLSWLIAYPAVIVAGQMIALIILLEYHVPHIDQVAVKQLKMTEESPLLFFVTAGLIVSIIPAIEEFLFRGLLQTWLKGLIGRRFAIVGTAFVFALFHFSSSQGATNWELLMSLFVLACFLGFLYERQKTLFAPIGLHATFNGVSIVLITLTS